MGKISAATVVPIGAVVAAFAGAVGAVRIYDANVTEIAVMREQVSSIDKRVTTVENALGENGRDQLAAWREVQADLAKVKERLGIVENKATK
jgi:hypothetical protein